MKSGPDNEPLMTPAEVAATMMAEPGLVSLQAYNGRFLARPVGLANNNRAAEFEIIARVLDGSALWGGRRSHPLKRGPQGNESGTGNAGENGGRKPLKGHARE